MNPPQPIVCVIAGGEWQLPLITRLKLRGYKVLVINLYGETAGALAADVFEKADVTDREACLQIAKHYSPSAILTDQSDIAVPATAYVAESLGLNGIGVECARRFTNKLIMREAAVRIGVPCPRYSAVTDEAGARNFFYRLNGPMVLKPLENQSSRGVTLINSVDEIAMAFDSARRFSQADSPVLAEEFIGGPEHTVEGFANQYGHESLAVSAKAHFQEAPMVASRLRYGPVSPVLNKLCEQNDRLVEGLALPYGITHAEYRERDGEYFLVEIAARGGGTKVSSTIIPIMSGVDANNLLIDESLGRHSTRVQRVDTKTWCELAFLHFDSGTVSGMVSEETILAQSGVVDFKYNFEVGDCLLPPEDDRSRHAHVIVRADSPSGLDHVLETVRRHAIVDVE